MWLLVVLILAPITQGLERKLSYYSNPGCESHNISLSYLKAEGPNDTLHYLWDFTLRPTLFLALTDINTNLYFNCEDFVEGVGKSFNFSKVPKYSFSLTVNKLIEFNDINDTAILTPEIHQVSYDAKNFKWEVTETLTGSKDGKTASLTMTGKDYNTMDKTVSGNFSIQLTAFGYENHDADLPRLLHSPNSTQCRIILQNMKTNSGFNESRYALELILVSSDSRNMSSKIVLKKNLDDENSPGIFSMVDVMTPKAQYQKFSGAFLQWRPIIYVTKSPSISNSSEIVTYNLTNVTDVDDTFANSLAYKFYGDDIGEYLLEQTVVSMGMVQDGFYKKTNYSTWTFLVNYGSPEDEKFSLLVILVMCIGLGLPTILMLLGGGYMCVKRIRRKKDELSLERDTKFAPVKSATSTTLAVTFAFPEVFLLTLSNDLTNQVKTSYEFFLNFCSSEVNLKCNEDYDCSALQNTKCVNGICNCKNDYVPANDKTACLPSMRLTTLCEEDLQCSSVMNKSYCDFLTRQCVCERGYRLDPYRRECIAQSKLHSPCMSTEDCERSEEIKGKVECRPTGVLTNTCECRLGFYERNEVCYSVGSPPLAISLTTLTALLTVKWML
ncbi:hypothetical protein RUM44_000898 [Polyplax serrata]|uniref:EGF-like domain-containing protein n=1 Tax=Polyplax serrata TaxID=468196 RepID=A0ABR1B900_POLSC